MLPPASDRYFDPVQVVQIGSFTAGLEGAVASPAGGMLLWGWMSDPDDEIRGLSCGIEGRQLPVELLDRISRPDIVEAHAGFVRSRDPRLGFLAVVRADEEAFRRAQGRVSLKFETARGSAASANRLLFQPGASFPAALEARLPVPLMRPAAVRRAAEVLLRPERARALARARQDAAATSHGPARDTALTVVIGVTGAGTWLRETLVYLDMSPDRNRLEVVLAAASAPHASAVRRTVRDTRTGLRVTVVETAEDVGPGGAVRLALDFCTAPVVLLMSEAVTPPPDLSAAAVTGDLAGASFALPRNLPRFDGTPHRFRLDSLHGGDGEDGAADPELTAWSPGLIAAERRALLGLEFPWSAAMTESGFWGALLSAVLASAPSELAGGAFVYAPPDEWDEGGSEGRRLVDAYGLCAPSVPASAAPNRTPPVDAAA